MTSISDFCFNDAVSISEARKQRELWRNIDYVMLSGTGDADQKLAIDAEIEYTMRITPKEANLIVIDSRKQLKELIDSDMPTRPILLLCGHGFGNILGGYKYPDLWPLMRKYTRVLLVSCMQTLDDILSDLLSSALREFYRNQPGEVPPLSRPMLEACIPFLIRAYDEDEGTFTVSFSDDFSMVNDCDNLDDCRKSLNSKWKPLDERHREQCLTLLQAFTTQAADLLNQFAQQVSFVSPTMINEFEHLGCIYMLHAPSLFDFADLEKIYPSLKNFHGDLFANEYQRALKDPTSMVKSIHDLQQRVDRASRDSPEVRVLLNERIKIYPMTQVLNQNGKMGDIPFNSAGIFPAARTPLKGAVLKEEDNE